MTKYRDTGLVIPKPHPPSQVTSSILPDPETTRTPTPDKSMFRKREEKKRAEVKEVKKEVKEERVFERDGEPEVRGTIVVTVYTNHPYGVEFTGKITGAERDLATRAIWKGYNVWKHKLSIENEARIKKEKEKEGGK